MKTILILLFTLIFTRNIYANQTCSIIEEYNLDSISIDNEHSLDSIFEKIMEGNLSLEDIKKSISDIFFKEIKDTSTIFKSIIFICIINGIITTLSPSDIGKTASTITYTLTIALCTGSLKLGIQTLTTTIDTIINLINSSLPVILSLLTASGFINGAAIAGAVMYGFINILNSIIKFVILPFISYYTVCTVINSLSPKAMLTKLGELFYNGCIWILRIIAIIFSFAVGLLKIYISDIDGTATRLATEGIKAVPVIGDIFSGSVSSALKLIASVKSGFGLALIVSLLITVAIPVLKILVLMLIYKVSAALVQPIGDKGIVELIDNVGNTNVLILTTMITTTLMFSISILILLTGFIGG